MSVVKPKTVYHSGHSQRTQTIESTNQNSWYIHVADTNCGKTFANEFQVVLVLFISDWIKKWRVLSKPIMK